MTKNKQKLELTWIGKGQEMNLEPRILVENPEKSYGDPDTENMLIHGDNLLALKALEQNYTGKIKCIYIDPPYNTGSAFEHYDDNVEHSKWLSLMKVRLEVLKKLLSKDGVIAVQIGFDEMAYLKVLMDEIFNRNNCIGQVAVRMSHSAGMKRKASDKRLIKNTEYILFYYKEIQPELSPLFEICEEYPVNYYQYINKIPNKDSNIGTYIPLIDVLYEKFEDIFKLYNLAKKNESIKYLYANSPQVQEFILENRNLICRKDSNVPSINIEVSNLRENEFIRYKKDDLEYYIGKNSTNNYYQIYSLYDKTKEIECLDENGNICVKTALTNLIGDWWDSYYKDMSRVDIEGGVKMKTSKKPERLIYNIFKLLTTKNDLILDSFLGSGTTAAVAHKMDRKWIGIELGEHCYTLCEPRLKCVVDGKDGTGISKAVNWQGGGGYKFYELAPSLLKKDEFGNWIIDSRYDAEMLAEAMAKQEGYQFSPDEENIYKQGYSTEKDFIFTTTQFLSIELLDKIYSKLKEDESLLICATHFEEGTGGRYDNITVKKIPQMLLNRCEFGKLEYNLNIINPPQETEEDEETLEEE